MRNPLIVYTQDNATRRQLPEESLDDYLRNLKILSRDCSFKDVTADIYQEESIRDSFIAGIRSNYIRQRLLENDKLDLSTASSTARSLEVAQRNSETYNTPGTCASVNPNISKSSKFPPDPGLNESPAAAMKPGISKPYQQGKCYYCGYPYHPPYK